MLEELYVLVRLYAPLMKSGLIDPAALTKLRGEEAELDADLDTDDLDGARTEVADVAYYAAKAVLNNLLDEREAWSRIVAAATAAHVDPALVPALVRAKYALRSTGVKDDAAERTACRAAAVLE